jgi:ribosomal protein L31
MGMKQHHAITHNESIAGEKFECHVCEDIIYRRPQNVGENPYCSRECYGNWISNNITGEDHPRYNSVTMECDFCESNFERKACEADKFENTFCSTECKGLWMSKNKVGENHPSYSRITVTCEYCDGEYETCPSTVERTRFCSNSCQYKWRSENLRGEDSPHWEGGSDRIDYGLGWNEKKRHTVRERDDFECQECGLTQEENIEEYGKKLNVHHITHAREFDDPHERNDPKNLTTLCNSCHIRIEYSDD